MTAFSAQASHCSFLNEKQEKKSWHGLLLLNKIPGITSFDSLKVVKRAFGTGKAGHTGTLDKFAQGLLLVLVGRGVKLAPLFDNNDKEYTGTIKFGEETDTLDPEGRIIATGRLPSLRDIEEVLPSFMGNILQAPPSYSAVHVNGERAHELARRGVEPEMKKRPVTVYNLELISWTPGEAVINAKVSSGTYIRSLARDIALAAGSRAYLSALTRTSVGKFHINDAVSCSFNALEFEETENLRKALLSLDWKLFKTLSLPVFLLEENGVKGFFDGLPLEISILKKGEFYFPADDYASSTGNEVWPEKTVAGVFRKINPGDLLGIIEYKSGKWSYAHVFRDS